MRAQLAGTASTASPTLLAAHHPIELGRVATQGDERYARSVAAGVHSNDTHRRPRAGCSSRGQLGVQMTASRAKPSAARHAPAPRYGTTDAQENHALQQLDRSFQEPSVPTRSIDTCRPGAARGV